MAADVRTPWPESAKKQCATLTRNEHRAALQLLSVAKSILQRVELPQVAAIISVATPCDSMLHKTRSVTTEHHLVSTEQRPLRRTRPQPNPRWVCLWYIRQRPFQATDPPISGPYDHTPNPTRVGRGGYMGSRLTCCSPSACDGCGVSRGTTRQVAQAPPPQSNPINLLGVTV